MVKPVFESSYKYAKTEANKLLGIWEKYRKELIAGHEKEISVNLFWETLQKLDLEEIGRHMIFTILFANPEMNLESVVKLRNFKFVKKYEQSVLSLDHKPVLSVASGRGILDYNRLSHQWWEVSKKRKFLK